jgi:hypothetical protein
MLGAIWLVLLLCTIGAGMVSYFYLHRVRRLIGYHLGMNIAMTSSGVIGLSLGSILGAQFQHFTGLIIIINTLFSIFIGLIFGALVDYQTLLTGVSSGLMSGLMGPMIGFHTHDPMLIAGFCTILALFSFFLLCYSVKV